MKSTISSYFSKSNLKSNLMLDIEKLEKQFDEILYSFSKEDLQRWLKFARQREERQRIEKFMQGEILDNIRTQTSDRVFVGNFSIKGLSGKHNPNYAEAA